MSLELEVRRIAHIEGFKGITDFLCYYISLGYYIPDIQIHMAIIHNLHYSRSHFFTTLNPYLKKARSKAALVIRIEKCKAYRYGFKNLRIMRKWFIIARNLGWFTPKSAVNGLKREGLTNKQIARYFGVTESALKKRIQKWRRGYE